MQPIRSKPESEGAEGSGEREIQKWQKFVEDSSANEHDNKSNIENSSPKNTSKTRFFPQKNDIIFGTPV